MLIVFGLLFLVAVLFTTNKFRPDLIALCAAVLLVLSGTLSAQEALSAFGNSTVIMIAALFVIGAGINNTGITKFIGDRITEAIKPGQEGKLTATITSVVGSLGAVMSSTGIVSLFIPVIQRIVHITGIDKKKIFMPLAYAGLISGMMTLISTPPNLIASDELEKNGFEPFGLLDFTLIGVSVLIAAVLYFLFINTRKDEEGESEPEDLSLRAMLDKYQIDLHIFSFRIAEGSELEGKSILKNNLRPRFGITLLGREVRYNRNRWIGQIDIEVPLKKEDVFFAYASDEDIEVFLAREDIVEMPYEAMEKALMNEKFSIAEVIIPFDSSLIGIPIREMGNRVLENFNILASKRLGKNTTKAIREHRLVGGETLLIWGARAQLNQLHSNTGKILVVDYKPGEEAEVNAKKAPIAGAITLFMILGLILDIVDPAITVLSAALLMIITRCMTMEGAYKVISWSTVVLVASMMPFSLALNKTGGTEAIASIVGQLSEGSSPYFILAAIFLLTSGLGMFISNTATAVILSPIAIRIAMDLGFSPYPFAMTVAIACSAAYLTPIASPVNMLVVTPGGYSFGDFFKRGIVLYLLTFAIALGLIPVLFPF